MGGLLLEQIEELLFPRKQPEHGSILSRHLPDVNGGSDGDGARPGVVARRRRRGRELTGRGAGD